MGFAGSNPIKFLRDYADLGLKKIPLLGGSTAMDDALLKSLGDEAIGVYSSGMYFAGVCVEAALKKTGGRVDDKQAFMEALRGVGLTGTPRGDFHFDHLGNVVSDIHIRRCERKNGKLVNTIIKIYPQVSQFWTYDEKAFLAQPVYSRDYPPARYLE